MEVACWCGAHWEIDDVLGICPKCGHITELPIKDPPEYEPPVYVTHSEADEMAADLELVLADHEPVFRGDCPDSA